MKKTKANAKPDLFRSVLVIWSTTDPDKLSLMDIAEEADSGERFYESLTTTKVAFAAAHPGARELLDDGETT